MFLDTTLLIDFLHGKEKAIKVLEKATLYPLFTSEINVFELVQGVYLSPRNLHIQLEKIHGMLTQMIVLPFDRKTALKAGMISGELTKEGKKIGEVDCLIAGVALANGITEILTENKDHFERIKGLKVLSY